MRQKMSKGSKKELLLTLQPQYRDASWSAKQKLLDGFIAATGYERKYAITLLNSEVKTTPQKRQRAKRYGDDIRNALLEIWTKAGNRLCSKRLVPILPTLIAKMEEFGHLHLSNDQKTKLATLSAATVDRLLLPERRKQGRGRGTTKPGFLIKKHIPIRTFADWNDAAPGFLEADLVAHCGQSVHGQFLNTLTVTDIATTWTEPTALLRRSEADVLYGLGEVSKSLPFKILGLDTDNGGEFINYALLNWCKENAVTFTRAREYKKNDQAHVEQKNSSVVRRLIGYDRYEGVSSWRTLSALYRVYRLYVNFFQPSQKLLSKSRAGARTYRRYEKAQTPFERVLKSDTISETTKQRLRSEFSCLDPVLLLREIERLQLEFWRMAVTEDASGNKTPEFLDVDRSKFTQLAEVKPRRKRTDKPAVPSTLSGEKRGRKTNLDQVWPDVCQLLKNNPRLTCTQIFDWLNDQHPNKFRKTQTRTIGEKLQRWRNEHYPDSDWGRNKPGKKNPLDDVWTEIQHELEVDPNLTSRKLMAILCERYPGRFRVTQRSTLVGMVKRWRHEHLQTISMVDQNSEITGSPISDAKDHPLLE
jgi:hypothetical protein